MELVDCDKKYWEFVRSLRNDSNNLLGFIETKYISFDDQLTYMKLNSSFFKILVTFFLFPRLIVDDI